MFQDRWRNRIELTPNTVVLRSDPYIDPDEGTRVEFCLTYEGKLLSSRGDKTRGKRSLDTHEIRRKFHKQLKALWIAHPVLVKITEQTPDWIQRFTSEGFQWIPLVTCSNGLICKLEIVMLRYGKPGDVLSDVDNRLKTVFDALKKPDGPEALGSKTEHGQATPDDGEDPFYVLLQDDRLITHVSVSTDTLLDPVPNVPPENAARLLINVSVKPYDTHLENLAFA